MKAPIQKSNHPLQNKPESLKTNNTYPKMNAPLPYLAELLFATEDTNEPLVAGGWDFSGYYSLINHQTYPIQMVFCLHCGNYKMANTIDVSNVPLCLCEPLYPKNRHDWRMILVQETYKKMKVVHKEMLEKFLQEKKEDMKRITELVVGLKTNTTIDWF